jgi:uncharacterized membrane protein YdfJ with MMPL/SSD domain
MDRLAGFLERRRWAVLAAWLLLLLAALPLAAKQTDHLFVLVFSYLVLFLLLRSVLLPLKAVLMNLLSVAAAYGVLVMVFQYGWFDGLLGYDSLGYVNAMTPPFLLAIVFGLSMDYEVFLLSRIRERYGERAARASDRSPSDATGDTKRAVAEGLRASAGTISSAALIMVAVFSVFAFTGTPFDQGDRRRDVGGDRARRDAGPADSGAGDDGDHGPLELVAAEARGPRAATRRLRGPLRAPRAGARSRLLARSPRCAPARACRGRAA